MMPTLFFPTLNFALDCEGPNGEYNVLGETLLPGKTMNVCDALRSANGQNVFALQSDGNAVVYNGNGKAKWQSKTKSNGTGSWTITFQTDGNLVLFNSLLNKVTWSSKTSGTTPVSVIMQDDSNLAIYGSKTYSTWNIGNK
jgi:outer membrane protein assembly factor BamB